MGLTAKLLRMIRNPLTPFEQALFARVADQMPRQELAKALHAQIRLIDHTDRNINGYKETNYWGPTKRTLRRKGIGILTPIDVWLLAIAEVHLAEPPNKLTARLTLVNGRLFEVVYSESIRPYLKRSDVTVNSIQVFDPADGLPLGKVPSEEELVSFLGEWARGREIKDIQPPIKGPFAKALYEDRPGPFPKDHRQLMKLCDGFIIDSYPVYGLSELQDADFDEASYCILAELEEAEFLACRCGVSRAEVVRIGHEGNVVKRYKGSFIEALEDYVVSAGQ